MRFALCVLLVAVLTTGALGTVNASLDGAQASSQSEQVSEISLIDRVSVWIYTEQRKFYRLLNDHMSRLASNHDYLPGGSYDHSKADRIFVARYKSTHLHDQSGLFLKPARFVTTLEHHQGWHSPCLKPPSSGQLPIIHTTQIALTANDTDLFRKVLSKTITSSLGLA